MAKYCGCLSTSEVCECECEEATEIMQRYHMPEEDIERVTDMIREAYFQLGRSYAHSNAVWEMLVEESPKSEDELIRKMLHEKK